MSVSLTYRLDSLFQLKAFYVDLLVPLETNLEKDTKVVQVRGVAWRGVAWRGVECSALCLACPWHVRRDGLGNVRVVRGRRSPMEFLGVQGS